MRHMYAGRKETIRGRNLTIMKIDLEGHRAEARLKVQRASWLRFLIPFVISLELLRNAL
jgi:hypothetical protein